MSGHDPYALTEAEQITLIGWLNTFSKLTNIEYRGRTNNHIFSDNENILFKISKDPHNRLQMESSFYERYPEVVGRGSLLLPCSDITLVVAENPITYTIVGYRFHRAMLSHKQWDTVPLGGASAGFKALEVIHSLPVTTEDETLFGERTKFSTYRKVAERIARLSNAQKAMIPVGVRNDILALLQEALYADGDLFANESTTLTHGDPFPQNLLLSNDGEARWIDYESVQITDPLWDVAKFYLSLKYFDSSGRHHALMKAIEKAYPMEALEAYMRVQLVTLTSFALNDATPDRFLTRYSQVSQALRAGQLPTEFRF